MKVAIVGAGITGLSLAHGLRARGIEVQVLERGDRVGGVIRSDRREGFITEAGPNSLLNREPATRALLAALGLTSEIRPASAAVKRRWVLARGALRPLPNSPGAMLKSDLLSLSGKLRASLEPFSGRASGEEDESVHRFFERHLGTEAADVAGDAMQTGLFAGDVRRLSLRAAFPALATMERDHRSLLFAAIGQGRARRKRIKDGPEDALNGETYSLEGGLESLTAALGRLLAPAIRLGTTVERLERRDQGWRVWIRSGDSFEVDRVVLTVPTDVAAALVRPLDSALAFELADVVYAPIAVVHLGFRRAPVADVDDELSAGFGFLVPERERRALLGVVYASSAFPWKAPEGHALFTCMVGGARHPERLELDDAALFTLVERELAAILKLSEPPVFRHLDRWARGIPQYNLGHLARLGRIDERLRELPGLLLAGNAYRGIGVNDCIRSAAVLTEQLSAEALP